MLKKNKKGLAGSIDCSDGTTVPSTDDQMEMSTLLSQRHDKLPVPGLWTLLHFVGVQLCGTRERRCGVAYSSPCRTSGGHRLDGAAGMRKRSPYLLNRLLRKQMRYLCICSAVMAGSLMAEPAAVIKSSAEVTSMEVDGSELWTYRHDPAEGKPYFHPLKTTNGTVFSELRPKDHPWHRGLWFSWKYINGVNYWEENRETGQSDGRTRLLSTERRIDDAQNVTIRQTLEYAPGEGAAAVLQESRRLVLSPPDASGNYRIDWTSDFHALEPLELSRTPILGEPGGKAYGGYAGLSIRVNKALTGGIFLTGAGEFHAEGIDNTTADWMIFETGRAGSLLMMDHPGNLRSPTKWYVAPMMPYFSPALLFDAAHTMAAGERLSLNYRILVSPESITAKQAADLYRRWAQRETEDR